MKIRKRYLATHLKQLFLVLILTTCGMVYGDVTDEPIYVDIPSQPLSDALLELGEQLDIFIVFDKEMFSGMRSKPLHGKYSPLTAYNILLQDTEAQLEIVDGVMLAVSPGNGHKSAEQEISFRTVSSNVVEIVVPNEVFDEATSSGSAADVIHEIAVYGDYFTGSRIRRQYELASASMDILGAADLELSGSQSLSEVFKSMPAVSGNSTSTSVSNGGNGTATVTLRGLPANHTLVLINGLRVTADGFNAVSIDINSLPIPLAAIDRIEIYKDGASAIYGSDAIAGVINVITKQDYDGLRVTSSFGETTKHDNATVRNSITWGKSSSRGAVFLGASYFDQTGIFSRDRSLSETADDRAKGGEDKRSSATAPARFNVGSEQYILRDGFSGLDPDDFREATIEDRYDYRQLSSSTIPSTRHSVYASGYYHLNDKVKANFEIGYSDSSATNQLAPTPLFTGFEAYDLSVHESNIYNPTGILISDVRRRFVELEPRIEQYEMDTSRVVAGLEAKLGNFDVDFNLQYAHSSSTEHLRNILSAPRVARALGDASDCRGTSIDGCVPLNLFGPIGSITADQLDYVRYDAKSTGVSRMLDLNAGFSRKLLTMPGGDVYIAGGLEYRVEKSASNPDILMDRGETIGSTNSSAYSGKREIIEFYTESIIPLMSNSNWGKDFYLELAARYSRYSDFGSTTNPKIGLRYRPVETLLLRATYSRGFKAPDLYQIHSADKGSFDVVFDPCSLQENISVIPGCSILTNEIIVQTLTIRGGNTDLKAEKAESFTTGFSWSPRFDTRLHLAIDYYRIKQRNVVDTSAQFIIDQNAHFGLFPERVIRDDLGNIKTVFVSTLNIGRRELSGMDFMFNYGGIDIGRGQLIASFNGSTALSYYSQVDPSSPRINLAGSYTPSASDGRGALPEWKANAGFLYRSGSWETSYTLRYISALDEGFEEGNLDRRIDKWITHDVQANYWLQNRYGDLKFTLGINNLLDEAPPFIASAFNDSFDPRIYSLVGRYIYGKLSFEL